MHIYSMIDVCFKREYLLEQSTTAFELVPDSSWIRDIEIIIVFFFLLFFPPFFFNRFNQEQHFALSAIWNVTEAMFIIIIDEDSVF